MTFSVSGGPSLPRGGVALQYTDHTRRGHLWRTLPKEFSVYDSFLKPKKARVCCGKSTMIHLPHFKNKDEVYCSDKIDPMDIILNWQNADQRRLITAIPPCENCHRCEKVERKWLEFILEWYRWWKMYNGMLTENEEGTYNTTLWCSFAKWLQLEKVCHLFKCVFVRNTSSFAAQIHNCPM